MVENLSTEYSFPSVSITEKVVGPAPLRTDYRSTIGVAGVFKKGPLLTRITTYQEFIKLYGEDNSSGSLFVQSALAQGATKFVISRVMPSAKKSSGAFSIQHPLSPTLYEPETALDDTDRTIGLKFTVSAVGDVAQSPGSILGTRVRTTADAIVTQDDTFANYNGLSSVIYEVIETVEGTASSIFANPITLSVANYDEIDVVTVGTKVHLLKFLKQGEGTSFAAKIKPGHTIDLEDGEGTPGTATVTAYSYAFVVDDDYYGIYIKGDLEGAGLSVNTSLTIKDASTTANNLHIIGYSYNTKEGDSLSDLTVEKENYVNLGEFDGFVTIEDTDFGEQEHKLLVSSSSFYEEKVTGIKYKFVPDSISDTEFQLVPGAVYSISFAIASVIAGSDDINSQDAFPQGYAGLSALRALRLKLLRDPTVSLLLSDISVNSNVLPYSLTFKSADRGKSANRLKFKIDQLTGTVAGLNDVNDYVYSQYGVLTSFVGGADSVRPATLYLYDAVGRPLVYIQAKSPGPDGNNLAVDVIPESGGKFKLIVKRLVSSGLSDYKVAATEGLKLDNYTIDAATGLYPPSIDSNLVYVYFVPQLNGRLKTDGYLDRTPQRAAPILRSITDSDNPLNPSYRGVSFLKDLRLSGGSSGDRAGTLITEADYEQAIDRLESEDIAILAAPGIKLGDARFGGVIPKLLLQAQKSTTENGLRIAVVPLANRISAEIADSLLSGYRSERLVVVANNAVTSKGRVLSPDGFYAGKMAVSRPHLSMASNDVGPINGVARVQTQYTAEELDVLTRAGIEVLVLDRATKTIKFLNGRTTNTELNYKWISVRRQADHIIMNLFRNLQWAKSQNNTSALWSLIASACDAFLRSEEDNGYIRGFQNTICSSANNTVQDIARGRVNVAVTYSPVTPADYINVQVIRSLTNEFSLDLGNG
jgi:hypothetical protein